MPTHRDQHHNPNAGWVPDDDDHAPERHGNGMRVVTAITIVALVLPMAGGVVWLLSQVL